MATVYRKTAKGQAEVETRAHRLIPRLRTALILVDGKREESELLKLIPGEPEATIRTLIDDGFIEVSAITIDKPRPTASRPADAQPTRPPHNQKAFEQHRQAAVRAINDLLGPLGEAAALRLERSKTWDELLAALEFAQRLVANGKGGDAAAEFGRQFIEAPPM
jgi:hypothetical protein